MFDKTAAMAAGIFSGICIFVLALMLVPGRILESVLGPARAMQWGFNVMAVFIVLVVVTNFIYAFGLCGVLRNANLICYEQLNFEATKLEFIYYLLLLVPIIRICGLLNIRDKVNLLLNANIGYRDESKFVQVEE